MSEAHGAAQDKQVLIFKAEPGFSWKGMNPDKKPYMLTPEIPQQMVNMRLRAGEVEGRGGQKRIASHGSPLTGIFDFFTEVVGGSGPAAIIPSALPDATLGEAYSVQLSAVGLGASYTFSEEGAMPDGITMDSAGLVSGTTTYEGASSPFVVTAVNSDGATATRTYTLNSNVIGLLVFGMYGVGEHKPQDLGFDVIQSDLVGGTSEWKSLGDFNSVRYFSKNYTFGDSSTTTLWSLDADGNIVLIWTTPVSGSSNPAYSNYTEIRCAVQHGTDVFFGLNSYDRYDSGDVVSSVFKWNGSSFTREQDFDIPISNCALFEDRTVWTFYDAGFGHIPIYVKSRSNSGVWTTINSVGSVTFDTGIPGGTMAVQGTKLYIPNGRAAMSLIGTTLTPITSATTGIPANSYIIDMITFNANIYFGCPTLANAAKIGQFDGAAWTPGYKDIKAQFPSYIPGFETALGIADSNLIYATYDNAGSGTPALYFSNGSDVAGTWTREGVLDTGGIIGTVINSAGPMLS